MVLQYIYKPILNTIYEKVTYRVPDRVRNIFIALCFFAIIMVQFLSLYENMGFFSGQVRNICVVALLIGVIVASVDSNLEIMQWNKVVYFVYAFIAAILLITGIIHEIGSTYVANACILLIVCMGIYFVWGNRKDYNTLFRLIAKAFVAFTLILMLYGVLRYPCFDLYMEAHSGGYTIMGINTNGFAKVLVPGVACAMYLLIETKSKSKRIVYSLIFGMSAYVLWMTQCRTGQLCDIAFVLVGVIVILFGDEKSGLKGKMVITVVISIIGGIILMGILLNYVSPVTAKYLSPDIFKNTEELVEKQRVEKIEKIERIKNIDKYPPAPGTFRYASAEGKERVGDSQVARKLNSIATGRVYLWASYLDSLTFFGASERVEYKSPHNLYVDISYKSGVIAGVLWLLFSLMIGMAALYRSIKMKRISYAFTLLMFIQYFLFAMFDTGTLLIDRSYIFVYYMALAPMFLTRNSTIREVNQ